MSTHYTILGVGRTATQEEIRRAYVTLARTFHPDKNKSIDATEKFQEIRAAFEVLSDPENRRIYDATVGPIPMEKPMPSPYTSPSSKPEVELHPEMLPQDLVDVIDSDAPVLFQPYLRNYTEKQLGAVLIKACMMGKCNIAQVILAKHPKLIHTQVNHFGMRGSLLVPALASGNMDLISLCMNKGLSSDIVLTEAIEKRNFSLVKLVSRHCSLASLKEGMNTARIVITKFSYEDIKALLLSNEFDPLEKLYPEESDRDVLVRLFKAIGYSADVRLLELFESRFEQVRKGLRNSEVQNQMLLSIASCYDHNEQKLFEFISSVRRKTEFLFICLPELDESVYLRGPRWNAFFFYLQSKEPVKSILAKVVDHGFGRVEDNELDSLLENPRFVRIHAAINEELRLRASKVILDPEKLPQELVNMIDSDSPKLLQPFLRKYSEKQFEAILLQTCMMGKANIAQAILEKYPRLLHTQVNHFGMRGSLLFPAVASGKTALVDALIQRGLSLNVKGRVQNETINNWDAVDLLYVAVAYKHVKVVEMLCRHITFKDTNIKVPHAIDLALKQDDFQMVKVLVTNRQLDKGSEMIEALLEKRSLPYVKLVKEHLVYQCGDEWLTVAMIAIPQFGFEKVTELVLNNELDPFEAFAEGEAFRDIQIRLFRALGRSLDFKLLKWFENRYKQVGDGIKDEVLISALLSGALELNRPVFMAYREARENKYQFCVQLLRSFAAGQFKNLCTEFESLLTTPDIWLPALFYSVNAEEPIKSILNKIVDHRSVQRLEMHELETMQNYIRNMRNTIHLDEAVKNELTKRRRK